MLRRGMACLILVQLALFVCPLTGLTGYPETAPGGARPLQGWCPGILGLAVSPDGRTAYVPFQFEDALLVVDLSTFAIVDSIDVSAAGTMITSGAAVLTPDGKRLYVANEGSKNVMVVDTEKRRVEKVLPLKPLGSAALAVSVDGKTVYVPSYDGSLYLVKTEDQSYRRISVFGLQFGAVARSPKNPDLIYALGTRGTGGSLRRSFFVFDTRSSAVLRSVSLADNAWPAETFARRLLVDADETVAFFGWLRNQDKGTGNFTVVDLTSFQVSITSPIENGVADFALNEKLNKAYILGFWSGGGTPQRLSVQEWDIPTSRVVRSIPVSPSADQRAVAIDPANPDYLYMTEADHNLLRKIEISTGKEMNKVHFNKADLRPYCILRDGDAGYLICHASRTVYKLDLKSGQLVGRIEVPFDFTGWGVNQGRLYLSSGTQMYVIDPVNGAIIEAFTIPSPFMESTFSFFGDKMVTLDYEQGGLVATRLLLFDARTMTVPKSVDLPREPHGDKVVVSPDTTKLYLTRGASAGGTTTVTVFDSSTLDVLHTIEIPPATESPILARHGSASFVEAWFDDKGKVLYLTGWGSVYKISMDTDRLLDTYDLIDAYASGGGGWPPGGGAGVALSPSRDKLFVISGDAHSLFTYNLAGGFWSTKVANLQGYFTTDVVCAPDLPYLYAVNERTDSVTLVDLSSAEVAKVIDLEVAGNLVAVVRVQPQAYPPADSVGGDVLYQEDFEDGLAQSWNIGRPSWDVTQDTEGNWVFRGQGHNWAQYAVDGWDDFTFNLRVKLLRGTLHINYRSAGGNRYYVALQEGGLFLHKESPQGNFADAGSCAQSLGRDRWHDIQITGKGGRLDVCVDGVLVVTYVDLQPLLHGSIGVETLDDSEAYVDDIVVMGQQTQAASCAPGSPTREEALYHEDFEDGLAQGWRVDRPSWDVIQDTEGNWVFRGQGHNWAQYAGDSWDDFTFKLRVKLLRGTLHINYRLAGNRYYVALNSEGVFLMKNTSTGVFTGLASQPGSCGLDQWHEIRITGKGSHLAVCVDGSMVLSYTDPQPFLRGTIGVETLDGSEAYVDGVTILGEDQE